MKELYELKEKLCDELKSYGKKDMSAGSLDVIDKLTHTIKNLDKIIDHGEDGYSGVYGRSYARPRRYSNGYSYNSNLITGLNDLMNEAKDERTKHEIEKFIDKIETM